MRTKLTRKERIAQQTRPGALTPDDLTGERERRRMTRYLGLAVAVLGVLLYVNTLGHQYALDDNGLILDNTITKRGWDGVLETFRTSYWAGLPGVGSLLYRPLSKAMFAAEWGLAPGRPALSHGVNVLLYGLTGFLLVAMLGQYLKGPGLVPVLAAALFIAHPLHTEVVANIKGRDEILSFLFSVLAAMALHRYATRRSVLGLLLGAAAFFLALLSKESAVTFLAVIPLMLYFFTDTPRARTLGTLAVLGAVTGLVLLIRQQVLGGIPETIVQMIDNYLIPIPDVVTQKATAIFLMGVYLKLLIVPYPLLSDGGYQHFPTVTGADWRFLLPVLVYAALAVYALLRLKKKDLVSFSILYFFITASVGSNLLFLIGTNYGERLMYAPSLGFCLALAVLLVRGFGLEDSPPPTPTLAAFVRAYRGPLVVVGLVVALYGVTTVMRNADWYDNFTLYSRDAQSAPRSARLRYALGHELLLSAQQLGAPGDATARERALTKAVAELNRAVEIYPEFARALHSLALAHQHLGDTAKARGYFEQALQLAPTYTVAHNDFAGLLLTLGDEKGAIEHYRLAVRYQPYYGDAHLNLGLALGRVGEQSARAAVEEQKRHNERGYRDHMTAATQSFQEALAHLKRAIQIAPSDYEAYVSVAAVYQYLGDERNAKAYRDRAEQIKRRPNRRD
jgi:tetratricopeptide (TPR) repeat protein